MVRGPCGRGLAPPKMSASRCGRQGESEPDHEQVQRADVRRLLLPPSRPVRPSGRRSVPDVQAGAHRPADTPAAAAARAARARFQADRLEPTAAGAGSANAAARRATPSSISAGETKLYARRAELIPSAPPGKKSAPLTNVTPAASARSST